MKKIHLKNKLFLQKSVHFYKQHLGHILFMVLVLGFLILIRNFPYINIIPQYNYYVVAACILLLIIFFRKQLTGKRLFIIVEVMIALALLADLFWINSIAQFLGFTIFTLLFIITLTEFFVHRKKLKDF